MEQDMRTIKELYGTIADAMLSNVEIGNGRGEENCFFYEEYGWYIEGGFTAEGESGYGENEIGEYGYGIDKAKARMDYLTVTHYDEDGNEADVPSEDIAALKVHLSNELKYYMDNIWN